MTSAGKLTNATGNESDPLAMHVCGSDARVTEHPIEVQVVNSQTTRRVEKVIHTLVSCRCLDVLLHLL